MSKESSDQIKKYLAVYPTSDKWVDPETATKLPTNQQGASTSINADPNQAGNPFKYVLYEDTRLEGYGFLIVLFEVDTGTDKCPNLEE